MDPIYLHFVTFLAGLFVGNRFALWRDKRKEFNDASQPIRAWLIVEIDNPSPYRKFPSAIELDTFMSYLTFWKRMRFRSAYKRQLDARREVECQDEKYGSVFYRDDTLIKKSLKSCLPYTNRK